MVGEDGKKFLFTFIKREGEMRKKKWEREKADKTIKNLKR